MYKKPKKELCAHRVTLTVSIDPTYEYLRAPLNRCNYTKAWQPIIVSMFCSIDESCNVLRTTS